MKQFLILLALIILASCSQPALQVDSIPVEISKSGYFKSENIFRTGAEEFSIDTPHDIDYTLVYLIDGVLQNGKILVDKITPLGTIFVGQGNILKDLNSFSRYSFCGYYQIGQGGLHEYSSFWLEGELIPGEGRVFGYIVDINNPVPTVLSFVEDNTFGSISIITRFQSGSFQVNGKAVSLPENFPYLNMLEENKDYIVDGFLAGETFELFSIEEVTSFSVEKNNSISARSSLVNEGGRYSLSSINTKTNNGYFFYNKFLESLDPAKQYFFYLNYYYVNGIKEAKIAGYQEILPGRNNFGPKILINP